MKKVSLIIIVLLLVAKAYSQESVDSHFGLRYTFSYDYELKQDNSFSAMHHVPVCFYRLKAHELYLGGQYTYVLQPTQSTNVVYQNNAFGVNIGYRYYSNELMENLKFFGQFNYSVFRVEFDEYQNGPPFVQSRQKFVVENTVSMGMNYQCSQNLNCFIGVGIGSFGGFFLLLDDFNLSNYLGLTYEF